MDTHRYSLIWYDSVGTRHTEIDNELMGDGSVFKKALSRLTLGPGALSGVVMEVRVVDNLDCTNFLWKDGKVVYPTKGDVARC